MHILAVLSVLVGVISIIKSALAFSPLSLCRTTHASTFAILGSPRHKCSPRPAGIFRAMRPLLAFPTTEEAGDVKTLKEGMAINVWEHKEECRLSELKYKLKLGEHVHPHIDRPALQPFPAALDLMGIDPPGVAVELLKASDGPLLTAQECDAIVQEAEMREEWVIGGDWHTQFPGIDLPVEKLPDAMRFLQTSMPCRLFPFVAAALPQLCSDPADLRVSDLFLVKYNEKLGQTSLRKHQDKGLISVNIALNPRSDFGEGGTYIDPLGRVAQLEQGACMVHSSGMWHAGHPITTGTRYILVCFLISTSRTEHTRRFLERGAMLRNAGLLMSAKRCFLMATSVLETFGHSEDALFEKVSGMGRGGSRYVSHDRLALVKKVDELWLRHRGRIRLLSLARLKLGVLFWMQGAHGDAFDELYRAGMLEFSGAHSGIVKRGRETGDDGNRQLNVAVEAGKAVEEKYFSLCPIAWALMAAVCADFGKGSVSGVAETDAMLASSLEWYQRAAQEAGLGGYAASNCENFGPDEQGDKEADRILKMSKELDISWSAAADLNMGLKGICGGRSDAWFEKVAGSDLEAWGESIFQAIDQADNHLALYLEADSEARDNWNRMHILRELEALMRAQEAEESARLESEATCTSREALYLRADLCATFLSEGALLEKMFGAGSGVDAFRRAVLCEPANTKAQMALKFAEEDSASKSAAIINGIIKP